MSSSGSTPNSGAAKVQEEAMSTNKGMSSSMSMTTTETETASAMSTATTTTTPAPIEFRSASELATLVKRRAKERDAWLVDGEPQPKDKLPQELVTFAKQVLPNYLRHEPPTADYLNEVFPIQSMNWNRICSNPLHDKTTIQLTWLGHASVLIQMNGCAILTDPVFSQRCSASQWFGPKRYCNPPCTIHDLCQQLFIDLVVISHCHYDHLDYKTIKDIFRHSPATTFVVPLGLRDWFHSNISPTCHVYELDWHEHVDYHYTNIMTTTSQQTSIRQASIRESSTGSSRSNSSATTNRQSSTRSMLSLDGSGDHHRSTLRIAAVPMRHWANRKGPDRDTTLWCGYSLETTTGASTGSSSSSNTDIKEGGGAQEDNTNTCSVSGENCRTMKVLFPGDTAWFDCMEDEVGQRYGPFDVAALPIGAYAPREYMKRNHINVEEAVRMKDAVQAKHAVPIHWGTFPLTVEPVMEPRETLQQLMNDRPDTDTFQPWLIGETKRF